MDEFDAARWNGGAPKRWSYVRQYLVRILGVEVQVFGTWEWQKRGVLHRHFLVRVEGVVSERRMRAAIVMTRRSLGFGDQSDCKSITTNAAHEIYYAAKYATKTADQIDGHRLIDPVSGEIKQARGFRPWSCSRRWGMTMQEVKVRQRAYAVAAGSAAIASAMRGPAAGAAGVGLDTHDQISTDGESSSVTAGPDFSSAALV